MNEDDRDEIYRRLADLEARIAKLEGKRKKPAAHPQLNGMEHPAAGITEGKNKSKVPTTEQSKRVADIFHRRHTTRWSDKEIAAYKKLGTIPAEDLATVEAYYKTGEPYLRRDLLTFLNNFPGELDRARAWQAEKTTSKRSTFTA